MLNVPVYTGDALELQLPLLGGGDSTHDWKHLLSTTGLLPSTCKIAAAIPVAGTLVICAALLFSFTYARRAQGAAGEF